MARSFDDSAKKLAKELFMNLSWDIDDFNYFDYCDMFVQLNSHEQVQLSCNLVNENPKFFENLLIRAKSSDPIEYIKEEMKLYPEWLVCDNVDWHLMQLFIIKGEKYKLKVCTDIMNKIKNGEL